MDSYSEHTSDYDSLSASETASADDVAAAIGADERRMHVRAYNYWVSLLDGRDYPSIEELDPANITDFSPNSVLLDFTAGRDNPATPYIGAAIRTECDLGDDVHHIEQVPKRSLLSRLTDHYMQIIANRAPIGFEAEFVNQRGRTICYRGILMPFSSDGDTIDFIYGVINWKDAGDAPQVEQVIKPALPPLDLEPEEEEEFEETFEPEAIEPEEKQAEEAEDSLAEFRVPDPEPEPETESPTEPAPAHLTWEDGPLADAVTDDRECSETDDPEIEISLDEDAGLADRLWAARESAEVCKQQDGRSRAALYRALAMAYDFAVAAKRVPQDYAEILDDAGVKSQARAPMTPIVKLVFGVDYDKTRLTEFAAALSYAERTSIDFGGFLEFVESQSGGLKALVAAERQARRPEPKPDTRGEQARAALRQSPPIALAELATNEEFALVVTRRNANGVHEVVALVSDEAMLERAIRRAGA